jgi:hypothetical protein
MVPGGLLKIALEDEEVKLLRDLWSFDSCPPDYQCPADRECTCTIAAPACEEIGKQIGLLHLDKRLKLLRPERNILVSLCMSYRNTAGQYQDAAKNLIDRLGRMEY